MDVIDTLVGAGIALFTLGFSQLFELQRSKKDIRLRSFDRRQAALNDVFVSLTTCYLILTSAIHSLPQTTSGYLEKIDSSIRKCNRDVLLNALWLSTAWPEITACLQTFQNIGIAVQIRLPDTPEQSRPPLTDFPLDPRILDSSYFTAGNVIGKALGIPRLENELRSIMDVPAIKDPLKMPST